MSTAPKDKLKARMMRKRLFHQLQNILESVLRRGYKRKVTSKIDKAVRNISEVQRKFFKAGLDRFETYQEFVMCVKRNVTKGHG